MRKAASKDILRTIWKEKKRFISIMLITTLGVTMMTGLSAGCEDLRSSADYFFDEQKLFDVSVLSTLGLTEEDVDVLVSLEGVEAAEGSYSEIVHTKKGDVNKTAEVKTVRTGGMNLPYVVEGELPGQADQIAVTGNYITDTGKRVGDKVIIEEMIEEEDKTGRTDEEVTGTEVTEEAENKITLDKEVNLEEEAETPNFLYTEYTISGVVVDAMDINNAEGSAAFRATPNADYTFFVLPEAIDSEVYTAVYLSMEGTEELLCYSAEYEEKITELVSRIEGEIKEQREQARYDAITGEAYDKINEAEMEMNEAFADAEKEFADAEEEIAENRQKIADNKQEIADGKQELMEKEQEAAAQIADARAEIADGYEQLEEGQKEINEAASQLYEGNLAMAQGRAQLEEKEAQFKEEIAQAEAVLAANQSQNEAAKVTVAAQVEQALTLFGSAWPKEAWNAYISTLTQVMMPLMQSQMSSGQDSMTLEQQQALTTALQNDPRVIQAAQDFGTALGTSLGGAAAQLQLQAAEIQNGLAAAENQIIAQETVITDLETRIGQETDENILTELQTQLTREKEIKAALEKERDGLNEELLAVNVQLQTIQGQITNMNQLAAELSQLAMGAAQTEAVGQTLNQAAGTLASQKAAAEAQIAAAWEEIEAGEAKLAEATRQIHEGKAELEENQRKLDDAVRELEENEQKARQEFADARAEIADGEQELLKGEQELLEGEQKLADGWLEYEEEKTEAQDKIAEARAEVEELDMTQWYVQDRSSLSGYVNVESDTLSIESLASVFTVVFFVVAILISLTTVTRMVEEERGLIGTYKALGFTDHEIRKKYVVYAFSASVAGGALGNLCGFVVLPEILFMFFKVMYLFPGYLLQFDFASGTISIFLFMLGIIGAAVWACESERGHLPAQLMRPKAPKMGSKVLLERVTFIWKHLSFLNKVTARNLFRYKKRLLMTILGISGCTALVLFGFAIKDSVAELMPLQYERVYKYDLLAATAGEDNNKLLNYMEENEEVKEYLNIQVESVKLKNIEGDTEKVQIMIFPEGADSTSYVTLTNVAEKVVSLAGEGIYLTENAAKTLGLKKGDTALIQNMDLVQKEVQISEVVKNYLGNNIYMSQRAYEAAFGRYEPNGVLANLSDSCQDPIGFSDALAMEDWIISSVSTQELKEGFSAAFTLINIVVYVVLVLAAGLAFVVLFTLATTNISERIRELATIKVLGFFDREVHSYVNKETLILTGIGILLGLPVGVAISSTLTDILDMPSIYFAVTIYPRSFFISAGVSLVFALMVQFLTDRSLDKIDMVEALKSVE